jgi:NAD+ synthase (glutamine-hydrolysing)
MKPATKVALAQINTTVGDFAGNTKLILASARQAEQGGAHLVLTPELSLCGYSAEDLWLRPAYIEAVAVAFKVLVADLAQFKGLAVVVGHVSWHDGALRNTASVALNGEVIAHYFKRELPNYGVFDEKRYFTAGTEACVFEHDGVKFGLNICEDAWFKSAPIAAKKAGAEVLLVLNASPFHMAKPTQRLDMLRRCVDRAGVSVLSVNLCGGQDELVFDGQSQALDRAGHCVGLLPAFKPALGFFDVHAGGAIQAGQGVVPPTETTPDSELAHIWAALTLGVHDYVEKNGFKSVILGLSGGIDSAVVLAIAVDALGAGWVKTVMMPSAYTADISTDDAQDMANRLGVVHHNIPIKSVTQAFEAALLPLFAGQATDTTEENLQSRVRGTLLMALSNKFGHLVLTTGNKSELTTGYCTLYGDMAGGFAVLKDIPKTLVYRLARWRNAQSQIIPERIITRAPSAELRPDQTDQDSLPAYEVIDSIIEGYIEHNQPSSLLIKSGLEAESVNQITRLLRVNEHKRRQSPPGPKITVRAFGRDWRYPLTNKFKE